MSSADANRRPPSPARRVRTRGTDRRVAFVELLGALAGTVGRGHDDSPLRVRLEAALRHLVPVRTLAIRTDPASGPRGRSAETICLEVPTGRPGRVAMLEAGFEPASGLDEWDVQTLQAARFVAALVLEIDWLRGRPVGGAGTGGGRPPAGPALIGSSAAMQAVRDRIMRVAGTDFRVLIEGESGVGKELVARQIHQTSRRARGPFVAINCAALVESLLEAELFGIEDRTATGVRGRRGKFEHADGGTLFLDEVSDLSAPAQAKLLRTMQDFAVERVGGQGAHRVDIRIVAATNRSLRELVARGAFRGDLFYRLSGVEIRVPPLRERQEDIPELARHFLARYSAGRHVRLAPAALDALLAHDWPGNVRELERAIERAVALAETPVIDVGDLPGDVTGTYTEILQPSTVHSETMRAWGSRYARLILERCGRNKREACRRLGISYHTLQAYLRYRPRAARFEPVESAWEVGAPPVPASECAVRPAGAGDLRVEY